MEFRHLRYFVTLAEDLHFTRAAERLYIAQPALSQQIAKLEDELGVALLARTRRSVALTDAGRVFLAEARALLEQRDEAVSRTQRAAAGHTGTLRLGFVGTATYTVLHPVLTAYRAAYPDVSLKLHEHTTSQQLARLLGGSLDVGILRLPTPQDQLKSACLLSEPVIVVLPSDHRLAGAQAIDPAELATEPFITVPRELEPVVYDRNMGICAAAGFSPRIAQEAGEIHTMVELASAGLGVAFAPASLAGLQRPGVAYRPLSVPPATALETDLAWRADNTSAVVDAFVRTAVSAVRDIAGADQAAP
jgi:DNA-binding transcriptional LysR family regulator